MLDTVLQEQYMQQAEDYLSNNPNNLAQYCSAAFLTGVQKGLDLREQEVANLKQLITQLGG